MPFGLIKKYMPVKYPAAKDIYMLLSIYIYIFVLYLRIKIIFLYNVFVRNHKFLFLLLFQMTKT